MAKFNKYRKKTKYKKYQFKLTEHQDKYLQAYCEANNITPIKAIKKILINCLSENNQIGGKVIKISTQKIKNETPKISKKQLNLFDLIEAERTTKSSL